MKPTLPKIMEGVDLLAEMIEFFPQSLVARSVIAAEIQSFVGTVEQLDWFIASAYRHFPKWKGLPYFRALYNTQYPSDDGIAPTVELPGYTSDDLEGRAKLREMEENDRRMETYKREALESGQKLKAFPLPDAKRLH